MNFELYREWFENLRGLILNDLKSIENKSFIETKWNHSQKGGGLMTKIKGDIIEKGGVNISTVGGEFSENMQNRIPGANKDPKYQATGISIVIHPKSPLIPSMHFNTRYIKTSSSWFGGGMDVTPSNDYENESKFFHSELKKLCDKHHESYYKKYKEWCDKYFFLPHRNEPRGIGGIFFDYLDSGKPSDDFKFVKDVGLFFKKYLIDIIMKYKEMPWNENHVKNQLIKRGRYVEFNLLHDRGTKFGLETGGNIDAILMSMPPLAMWK